MADADNKIEIEITLDDGKVVKGLAMIKDEGTKTADALAFSFANVGTKLLGLAAAAASIGAIKVFLGDAVNQAVRAEAAVTKINNALKMAGTYTQEASRQFQEMADRIQRLPDNLSGDICLREIRGERVAHAVNSDAF